MGSSRFYWSRIHFTYKQESAEQSNVGLERCGADPYCMSKFGPGGLDIPYVGSRLPYETCVETNHQDWLNAVWCNLGRGEAFSKNVECY